eukprot:gene6055-4347_t
MSLTGGSEEVAEFLRNYTLPPKALHNLHHLQVSSEAFTQQPAEILRLLGFMNELEIHHIVSDWREYSSSGYSPSYIDRLLDEFHQPNVLTDPSDDLTISFSAASFLDIPDVTGEEEIPVESSIVPPKSVSFAPSPVIEKPKVESSPSPSPSQSSSSAKTEPRTNNPLAPAATNNTTSQPTAAKATTTQATKDKPDLADIIRELRALVDQRTVENDYLRLQNNSHVEDVERRAREYKELRDEHNQWKKTARETESKLRQTESLHQVTLAELEEAQRALGRKHTQLMRVQEDLQEQQLLSNDLEQEILSLRKVIAGRKGVDAAMQSDRAMVRSAWTLVTGESVSIEPVEREEPLAAGIIIAASDAMDRLQVSHINEEDDRLMSGDVRETVGADDEEERGISTDTHDLHGDEDFVPTSSRITVAKKGSIVVQDPWPNLSYAQLLDKYRTLEEESTEWQKKQYQELIDAQSEVRRLEVVLVEQHEEANTYKERYEKLLVSSISEINATVIQEKAESAEAIATLQQQREGYLAKMAHLQESLAQRDAVIEEKDREIQRLRRQLQGSAFAAETPPHSTSSRLPPNITEGRAIEVAQSNAPFATAAAGGGGSGDDSVETWSRERVKEKVAHDDWQEKHRWEEKEKLYLMNMDHLSASLKELTAVFHQQQEQFHQLLPPIHSDQDARGESRNSNINEFDPKATSFSDPGAGALVFRGRPVPPGSNNGGTAAHPPSSKGKAFQHRHRALKAAVKSSTDGSGSPSPPRLVVVDAYGSPLRVDQQQQPQQQQQQQQHYPDALYFVDDEGSDNGHVAFVVEQEQRSPTTWMTDQERKQLEKEQKDRLLAKAYDPESLRRIYFHPANKVPQRPSTSGANKGPTSSGGGGRPSTGSHNRPASSSGYKQPQQQQKTTGRKHEKARPRTSLVANFIQGLELRYHEDLARMIQLQQEQDAPFYEHLAQAVGQPRPQSQPQPQQPAVPPQQQQRQQHRTRPAAADPILYPEMQSYYPQYPVPSSSSSSTGQNKNQHRSYHQAPPPITSTAAAAAAVSEIDEEEAASRGHRGGGFFITPLPQEIPVVSTPPRRRSRGHDTGPDHYHPPPDGEVPLTSYPMMHPQHSISSVGSSSGHSSMAPSQFSSPSMVLHPSNSQPTDAFLLLLQQDSLHQDSLQQQVLWKESSVEYPPQQHPPQQPPPQQVPQIVFHQNHGLRAINRSSSASY